MGPRHMFIFCSKSQHLHNLHPPAFGPLDYHNGARVVALLCSREIRDMLNAHGPFDWTLV